MSSVPAPNFTARLRSSIILLRNTMSRQIDASLPLSLFPAMSVVFFILLWVVMFRNGSVDAMNLAIDKRELSPGQPLQVQYTGIPPVDNLLVTLVAFTYPVTSAEDMPSMLLMVDIVSTLQTALLWAHLDNNRVGRRTKWLAYPAILFLAVNAMGAAVILPIYFYLSLQNQPTETESWISLWNAKPLTLSLVVGSLVPGLAEITAVVLPRSGLVHQYVIAFMQISPLVMSAVQYIASGLYPIRNIDVRTRKSAYIPSVQQALLVAGAFSAVSHAIVLGNILLGNQSIRSIYIPDSAALRLVLNGQQLLEGSRLFLQYDYIGIFLSIVLWCNHLISSVTRVSNIKLTTLLATASLVAGPAAVGCAVLSWREQEMLERREHARKMRQSQKA